MAVSDARFEGAIPTIYDDILGPLVFAPYADDLAARLRDLDAGVVLETAAGTGVVTRALAKALSPRVRIVATDLNEPMLRVAESRSSSSAITWRQADAQHLPIGDAEVDAVVCQFGMMFVPDKDLGYREARRVLRPGGRFVFSVWDALDANEVTRIASDTVAAAFSQDPPRFMERGPFGYHDVAVIRAQLERAGFQQIAVETVEKVTRAPSAELAAEGLCKGTPVRSEIEARAANRLGEITTAVRRRSPRGSVGHRSTIACARSS